jgi:hypothetical protein
LVFGSSRRDSPRSSPESPLRSSALIAPLKQSLELHLRRPLLLLLVLSGSLTLFGLGNLANPERKGPDALGRGYALPPMDTFSDLELADGLFNPWAPAAFVLRVVMVTCAIALVLKVRPGFRAFLRVAAVYVLSTLSITLPVLGGVGYARLRVAPQSALADVAIFGLFLVWPLIFLVLSVLLAPMSGQAVAGRPIRPVLRKGAIWLMAAAGTLIWVFLTPMLMEAPGEPPSTARYVVAFLTVLVQSWAYGGIALAAVDEPALIKRLGADSS